MAQKQRVLVLGAGPAGLAAAMSMTDTPELRARYDVTILQVGYRAGGKCASGREGPEKRIVQNGTHYFFGCYANALHLMRRAYDELEAQHDDSFGTFEQNVVAERLLVFKQFFEGSWHDWMLLCPKNGAEPGRGGEWLRPHDYLEMLVKLAVELTLGWRALWALEQLPDPRELPWPRFVQRLCSAAVDGFDAVCGATVRGLASTAVRLASALAGGEHEAAQALASVLVGLRAAARLVLSGAAERNLGALRAHILVDLSTTAAIGMLRDGVLGPLGYGAVDHYDFRKWLAHHGASETALWSPPLAMLYDSIGAYEQGDTNRPNLAAGVALHMALRAMLSYRGAFAYQFEAEVADSFVAPVVEALRHRGVKFLYFHRVWDLVPSADGKWIDSIDVERQVELNSGDPYSYDPFIVVRGRKAWPERARGEQIATPGADQVDLESFYVDWTQGQHLTLQRGADFDSVVLAMPHLTLPFYGAKLLAQKPPLAEMVSKLTCIESQSVRLYFKGTLKEIGWPYPNPILSAYAQPFATWEDNGQLVDVETWSPDLEPKSIATLFAPLATVSPSPPPSATGYPAQRLAEARAHARAFLEAHTGPLWPKAVDPAAPPAIDWSVLVDPLHRQGVGRYAFQSVQANVGPIQDYVTAEADVTRFRIAPDESGYINLLLAGDWTRNTVQVGSVEGAVVSGMQASRALCGEPRHIIGEIGL